MSTIKRSKGITLIAVYTGVGALFSLLIGVSQLLLEATAVSLITGIVMTNQDGISQGDELSANDELTLRLAV